MQASFNGFGPSLRHLSRSANLALSGMIGIACLASGAPRAQAQVNVLTQHNDILRTGANLQETILNTTSVNAATFGKIFSRTVNGDINGQPLVYSNVQINGGAYQVVFVATSNNNVYAFDAENPNHSAPLWQVNLGPTVDGSLMGANDMSTSSYPAVPGWHTTGGTYGVQSTPVIDPSTGTLYVCAAQTIAGQAQYVLQGLDVATGAEKFGGPVTVSGSVPGTGEQSVGGTLSFHADRELQRPGLLLANGKVYIAFGGHADMEPLHGWVIAYNANVLGPAATPAAVFCSTPNGARGAIWQSGQGLSSDASGNVFVATGDGTFNANLGGSDYGDSILQLTSSLSLTKYFTPFNQNLMAWYQDASNNWQGDLDLGSSCLLLIPGTTLAFQGSKDGKIYEVDTNNISWGYNSVSDSEIVDSFQAGTSTFDLQNAHQVHNMVYWLSTGGPVVYAWPDSGTLQAYQFSSGKLVHPTSKVGPDSGGGFADLSLSANGTVASSGVLWAATSIGPALRAYNASNVATEIWNSTQNSSRDGLPSQSKWATPTVANGKVYVATTSNQLVVYGLLSAPTNVRTAAGDRIVALSWEGLPTTTGYNVKRSVTQGGPYTTINSSPIGNYNTVASTTSPHDIGTYVDTSVTANTTYYYQVTAITPSGEIPAPEVSATPVDNSSIQANIVQAAVPPVIDGNATDPVWATATWYDLKQVFLQVPASTSIYSARFKTAWDATNLYVLFDVTNPTKVNDSVNPWDDDTVELYIDSTNSKAGSYGANDYEFVFRWNDPVIWSQSNKPTTGMVLAQQATATGYVAEISIPWSTVNVTPSLGGQIGIDAASTNDDDGGPRESRIAWKDPNNEDYNTPSIFGTGVLSGVSTLLTSISVSPSTALVDTGGQVQFQATANDGTGTPLPTQPAFVWTVSGGGTIDPATGLFTAGSVGGGPFTVTATSGAVQGTAAVTVNDPNFMYPVPILTSLLPTSTINKGPTFTLTVNGTNFAAPSLVQWNGAVLPTTFVSPTQLTATVPATDIVGSGIAYITVFTPAPGGGTSTPLVFTINSTLLNSFSAGLQMFSVPEEMSGIALTTALGIANPKLAVWDPTAFSYALTPTPPADAIHLGHAYWARFPSTVQLFDVGTQASQSTPFSIALQAGWNMVGDPFPNSVSMANLIVLDDQGTPYNLADANKAGLIYPTFYSYDPASNKYVNHTQTTGDTINPYLGYWVKAFKACTLRVSAHGIGL